MIKTNMTVDYEIENKLGEQGCFGNVFLANDINLNRKIVVKEIPEINIKNKSNYFKESKILYEVKHSNIVEIHCAGFKNAIYEKKEMKHICLFMPYYENGSLEGILEKRQLNRSEILNIISGILQGLHCIHSKRLSHLDLKPDNILFDANMKPLITDFGVSEYLNKEDQIMSPTMPVYLKSPEAATFILKGNANVESQQTDIYQMGVLLYLMLKGFSFKKFMSDIKLKLRKDATPIDLLELIKKGDLFDFKDLDEKDELTKILKKMLHKKASMRYSKVLEISNDISKKC